MTDKDRWTPTHIALLTRVYREHLYGATMEAFEMTLRDIARRCGVRVSTVEDWITGAKKPTDRHLEVLIDLAVEEGFSDELAVVFELWGKDRGELVSRGPVGKAVWGLWSWIESFSTSARVKKLRRETDVNSGNGTPQEGTPIPIHEDWELKRKLGSRFSLSLDDYRLQIWKRRWQEGGTPFRRGQ